MTWDYRIFENLFEEIDGSVIVYDICEVYYDDDGKIDMIMDVLTLECDTLQDAYDTLDLMCAAKNKPIITWEEYLKFVDREIPY